MVRVVAAGAACKVCMGTRVARCAIDAMPAGDDVGYMAIPSDDRTDKVAGREYTCDPNSAHNTLDNVVCPRAFISHGGDP